MFARGSETMLGVVASFVRCFFGFRGVPLLKGDLCLVLDDQFDSASGQGINTDIWSWEVDLGGFG